MNASGFDRAGLPCTIAALALSWCVSSRGAAQQPELPSGRASQGAMVLRGPSVPQSHTGDLAIGLRVSDDQARSSVQWLASLALDKTPRVFSGDKNWGEQKKIWAGVRVKRDGFKIKTHRRFRELNQGRWTRYEIRLPPPTDLGTRSPSGTGVKIRSVSQRHDPVSSSDRWIVESSITAPMTFTAQVQRWNLGVKLFSVTVRGDLRVRLDTTASVDFLADYSEVPPAMVIDPRVESAHLTLEHFEVDRVSKIGGDVAEEWGEWMESVIREKFLAKENERLVAKLNQKIDKERDDLRLSWTEWFTQWTPSGAVIAPEGDEVK